MVGSERLPVDAFQSRREPAGLRPSAELKAAFGPFCANVRRLGCLTGTQKDIAILVAAAATLQRGYSSFTFGSLSELTQVRPGEKPFAGLGKNDLSPGLAALASFGIVRLDEKDALEAGACPVWVLTVFADVRVWSVRASDWSYTREERQRLADHWEACSQRFTPALPTMAVEPDLTDGLAAVQSADSSPSGDGTDARRVLPRAERRAEASWRSECRNAGNQGNGRCVPKVGTRSLSLKTEEKKELKINLKGYASAGPKEALLTIELTNNDDEVREAIKAIFGDEAGERDAGKWIVRRWSERGLVHDVFCDVVDRLNQNHLPKVNHPGGLAESYWKKLKESFKSH